MAKTKKGKTWGSKPKVMRYFQEDHRTVNKIRRILKNNGPVFLERWKAKYAK